ncbi:MAG: putative LPS assembly protein LptD [Gemmatimonadota bacterium]
MPTQLAGQEPVPSAASRADSLQVLVLDRLRTSPEPEAEADSLAASEDSIAGPSVEVGGVAAAVRVPAELPADADSLMGVLARLQGFTSASYRGVRADVFAEDRRLVLQGSEERRATFSGDGYLLEADSSLTYSDREQRVRTSGPTDFTPLQGEPVRTERLVYDLREERGTATNARTTYDEGARWIVQGNLDSLESGLIFGSSARFTSCDLEEPHSYFEASQLKVLNNRVLVARSVRMYVDDVPVLWLPFIAQNLERDRASGLLTPVFSMNDIVRTSSGYKRRLSNLGFYWAMSDYSDLSIAVDWYADNYTALQTGVNYAWNRQFLRGSLSLKHYWGVSGRRELGLNTSNDWRPTERITVRAGASFISSSEFVIQNSLDPREISQTVDSDVSLSQRLDWGNLTIGASRRQYLNEDRTEFTLPSASFSLSTLTLLGAPPQTARWYNNIGVNGSANWSRRIEDRTPDPEADFSFNRTSRIRTQGSARGGVNLGDLSLQGDLRASESVFQDVPGEFFPTGEGPLGDFRSGDLDWSASLSYRLRLIGTTTLSPNFSFDGTMLRVDSIPEAQNFVQSPVRARVGLSLQSDIYGFYPGFRGFEAVRHKLTPGFTWSYAPEVQPTELQERVFGGGFSRVQNVFGVSLNQTWEAKVEEESLRVPETAPAADLVPGDPAQEDSALALEEGVEPPVQEVLDSDDDGPSRLPPSRVVTLLALNTSALTYDRIQADSTGRFVDGFTTTTLSNTISSDYLAGLSLSFSHSLFDDSERLEEGGSRRFAPHLSTVNLGFGLNHRSGVVTALRRFLGLPEATAAPEPTPETVSEDEDPEALGPEDGREGFDSNRVIPGDGGEVDEPRRREGWDASIQYSLQRPRETATASAERFQTVSAQFSFAPSQNWTVDWRTSYNVEDRSFNDHIVRLRRDLHEWDASMSFRQTVTGNWSFQFEISLRANQDLRFDFDQRSVEGQNRGL